MSHLLIGCLMVPMFTAVMVFLVPGGRPVRGGLSFVGGAVSVLLSGALLYQVSTHDILVAQMGGWAAPFGITLVADVFSAVMLFVATIVGLCVAAYAIADIDLERSSGGFHTFLHMLMAGVAGAFLTGDLFNLYVWFEVMLIASFALMVLGGNRVQLDGAVKYVAINLISTVLLLTAIGLVYGLAGTLNMADLNLRLAEVEHQNLVGIVSVLFVIAFGIKAAMFPMYFWLPAAYHTPPVSVSALFAGLMTKVGVYALLRTLMLVFDNDIGVLQTVLLTLALITMVVGVLGAMVHQDIRRILSYHVIASIGFMLLGLGLGSALAMSAAIFYMLHGMLLKTLLFMMAGVIGRLGNSFMLSELGGLYRARPLFAIGFLLAALSLIGIPPLAGFWAKVLFIQAGVEQNAPWVVAIILLASLLTFIPLIRIWSEAFWKGEQPAAIRGAGLLQPLTGYLFPISALSVIVVAIGAYPGPLLELTARAANDLLIPHGYLEAVLGTPQADTTVNSP